MFNTPIETTLEGHMKQSDFVGQLRQQSVAIRNGTNHLSCITTVNLPLSPAAQCRKSAAKPKPQLRKS